MSCMLLYVFDMFHILLSGDSLRDLWNVYMYVDVKYVTADQAKDDVAHAHCVLGRSNAYCRDHLVWHIAPELRQWSQEGAVMLRYMHNACVVYTSNI